MISGLENKDFQVLDNGHPQNFRLDTDSPRYSIAVLVQASQRVRAYLPFIEKVGSTLENSLQSKTGQAAVIEYEDDVNVLKPFGSGDVEAAIKRISVGGEKARLFDAGMEAIRLLQDQAAARSKILLIIGQPYDSGSSAKFSSLADAVARDGVSVFTLTLPIYGKSFIADTFSLQGSSMGGFVANVELTKLGPALKRSIQAKTTHDPFSLLVAQRGGMTIHFRKQNQLESALIAIGAALHTTYILSYSPTPLTTGYHAISVKVDVPGATTRARSGYSLNLK